MTLLCIIPNGLMHLSWLGQTAFKIQTKTADEEIAILIDGYKPAKGEFPRSFSPTVALFSHGQSGAVTLSGTPFIVDTLGEFDIKNVLVTAFPGPHGTIIFKVTAEGISLVHLGPLHQELSDELVDKLGTVDILVVPVGGAKTYLDAEKAAAVVSGLEPRLVIPMGYQCDTDPSAEALTGFIKEIGLKPEVTDKKLIIKSKDLPQDEMKLVVLEKS